jgi:hypothetical protein
MSKAEAVWIILWEYALGHPGPFEIDEVVPEVERRLGVEAAEAKRLVGFLLTELSRLPEGEQYFAREGNAVVPLAEFEAAPKDPARAEEFYPFEE